MAAGDEAEAEANSYMSHTKVIGETHIGSEVPMEKARFHILKRIMAKVEQADTGCWIWKGFRSYLGYGHITVQGKTWTAHRLTYTLFKGEIPAGMQACHTCDVPACCNPDHVFLGTARDNARDSRRKGRHFEGSKTHCDRGHEYAVHGMIRADGKRACRECEKGRWFREKSGKGRSNKDKTHCIKGHPLAGDNLYVVPSTGFRQCRACRLEVIKRIQDERRSSNGTAVRNEN